ncbi:MAG: trehalose-6-phosphate synthase, partial [Acidimicrobiales bacterium]|nr:trehalose-6-phosphate synthase [Acidimicrobiales bacterium]
RDGMNLVAKEYVAAQTSGRGALVLSEFAGTAVEFTDAYLCNPFDLDGLKRVLLDAINAPAEDKRRRMDAMRSRLHSHDVHHWAGTFLHELR